MESRPKATTSPPRVFQSSLSVATTMAIVARIPKDLRFTHPMVDRL